jgi:hypothetical protein
MPPRPTPTETATRLWRERYPSAIALFCAGSVIRGEDTAHSDLDIVVLFERVPNAWRESLVLDGWPVELFVHDPETLAHFVERDVARRQPSLPSMVAEAIVVPAPSPESDRIQAWARNILANPPLVSAATLDDQRYLISDALDDLRDPRPRSELVAIAVHLHDLLGAFMLKSRGRWSATGKHLPRLLQDLDPTTADAFQHAFDALLTSSDPTPLITFTERVLEPFGGPLFDGYRSDAPVSARSAAPRTE